MPKIKLTLDRWKSKSKYYANTFYELYSSLVAEGEISLENYDPYDKAIIEKANQDYSTFCKENCNDDFSTKVEELSVYVGGLTENEYKELIDKTCFNVKIEESYKALYIHDELISADVEFYSDEYSIEERAKEEVLVQMDDYFNFYDDICVKDIHIKKVV